MKTLDYLAEKISAANSVLVFCHVRPDGDTLGSAFALKKTLEKIGKKCGVVCDSEIPAKFGYMHFSNETMRPESVRGKYELHVAVDVASESMLGGAWGLFKSCGNEMCIDHHMSNERYVKDCYVEEVAATAILIYELIGKLGIEIDTEIAACVLLGIVTDTGCFVNPNTDARALSVASKAVECGADYGKIIYETRKTSKNKTGLLGEVLSGIRYYFGGKVALICTSNELLSRYDLKSDGNEGFVDYPLRIDGVCVSVSLLEDKKNLYRVSFRSRGEVDVNAVAAEFGGGGHVNASGCVVRGLFEEVVERIVRAIEINSDF